MEGVSALNWFQLALVPGLFIYGFLARIKPGTFGRAAARVQGIVLAPLGAVTTVLASIAGTDED